MNKFLDSRLHFLFKPGAIEKAMLELNKKDGKIRLRLSILLLIAVMLLVYVFAVFNRNQILNHNAQLCETTTKQSASNVKALIDISLANLRATALVCAEDVQKRDITAEDLKYLCTYTQFDRLLFVDNRAWGVDEDGNHYNLIDNMYYLDALEGNSGYGVSTMSPAGSHTRAAFYVPVYGPKKEFLGVLFGYYSDNKILNFLGEEHKKRDIGFYIIDKRAIILASSEEIAVKDNIFKHLYDNNEINEELRETLLDAVTEQSSIGMVRETKDGDANAFMEPIPGTNNSLLLTFPAKDIADIQQAYVKNVIVRSGLILVLFFLYTAAMAKISKRQNQKLLATSNELLNIINGTTKIFNSFLIMDLNEDRCTLHTNGHRIHGFKQDCTYQYFLDNVCTQYFRATNIGEDCSKLFALENLLVHLQENDGTAYAELYDRSDHYLAVNVITLKEKDGKPCQLLFTVNDITSTKKAEMANKHALQEANETLKELAARDTLTGCHSRQYVLSELLDTNTGRFKNDARFSIAILDIDHFKEINDTYGHKLGDVALVTLVNTTYKCIRANKGDYVVRFGGDEFVVLYQNVTEQKLRERLELLRQEIRAATFETAPDLRLTISIGAVFNNDPEARFTDLFAQADKKLYAAKESGRNQIKI